MRIRFLGFIITTAFILAAVQSTSAQSTWARTYGGGSGEYINEVNSTMDGGDIAIGYTGSFGVGNQDIWIVKVDSSGSIQWQKAIGTADIDIGQSIQQTSDGGYIAAAFSLTNSGVTGDIAVIRLDSFGNVIWQKYYGGSNMELAYSVRPTSDGGFIVAGSTLSFGIWDSVILLKLNSVGSIQWQKTYSDPNLGTSVSDIRQTSDDGYIFTGGFGNPIGIWVVRLDNGGSIVWQKLFTGVDTQRKRSIRQTLDGGFVIAATTDDDSTAAIVLVKLDAAGGVQWERTYDGGSFDVANSVVQLPTGEYVVAGMTQSFGAGNWDTWILKLDSLGNVLVQKTYGGLNADWADSVTQTSDGGFLVAGSRDTATSATFDLWLLKLDNGLDIAPNCPLASDTFATVSLAALPQTTPAVTVTNVTVSITDSTLAVTDSLAAVAEQCSGQTCIYCDDFEDGILAADWSYLKPAWSESGGSLVATPVKKGVALASPVFAGCSDCAFETDVTIAGGQGNRVWILAWYADKGNTLEVLLKEESDKIIVKQRLNGALVAKAKGAVPIDSDVNYNIRLVKDSTQFSVLVDGNSILTMPVSGSPSGTIGLEAKNTTCRFGHVSVE